MPLIDTREIPGHAEAVERQDLVRDAAFLGVTTLGGQACQAGSRLLVHESIRAEVVAKLKTKFESVRLGDPLDPATTNAARQPKNSASSPAAATRPSPRQAQTIADTQARGSSPWCDTRRASAMPIWPA